MSDYEKILYALQRFYIENGNDRSLDYNFGYLDALHVIKELQQEARMK